MAQVSVLPDVEIMALRGAMIGLFPPRDGKKLEAFERELSSGADYLRDQFEREDGILNNIEVRNKLWGARKVIDRFGGIRRAVLSILSNRRERPPVPGQHKDLLGQVVAAAVEEAGAVGLDGYVEWVDLATYCSVIVHGPDLYRLPLTAPAGITRPLGYVPSVRELRPADERR